MSCQLQRFAKVLSKAEEGDIFFVECKWGKLVCTILRLDVLGHLGRESVHQIFHRISFPLVISGDRGRQETCQKVDGKKKILIMRMKLELKQRYQNLLILWVMMRRLFHSG